MKKNATSFLAMVSVGFFLTIFASECSAADFSTALTKTLTEIPAGADVAGMGSASTATPEFSSQNPAIIAVPSVEEFIAAATATYGRINFKGGLSVDSYAVTSAVKLPVGTTQITVSNSNSNLKTVTNEMDEFDGAKFNSSPSIELQYGLPVANDLFSNGDALYLGMNYAYSQSKITLLVGEDMFMAKSIGHTIGAGALYQIAKVVNFGVAYEHSWDTADNFINDSFDANEKSQSDKLRLGIGMQVMPLTFVAADYQHLYLPNGEKADQYFAGIEQYLIKDRLAIYGGWANGGATAGIGIYLKNFGINLIYMHHPFQEMDDYFGKAEMLMFSIYGSF